jgi:hypothetical protein
MIRIFIVIHLVCTALLLATCERSNIYDMAKYGLSPQAAIYIFPINQQGGSFGGRNNADSACYRQGISYLTLVKANTVKAFVSFSAIDEIRFLVPVQYWYFPVIGISPSMSVSTISNTWLDIWDGISVASIIDSVGLTGNRWWSGSNADGSTSIGDNCSEWQKSDGTYTGRYGDTVISSGSVACSDSLYILCVAY